ncbi:MULTISPECIES: polysaccharide deacetylase family protein [unclassified Afipia]|uniref:polysaccharide deacetylase family protein n=1 Tax=unclassified Afipia TaxID=2642050 RepID=UPI00046587F1|nr:MULTISPECIES: polysaccharide deacetylase family protein [unclassified Afipia]
MEPIAPFSPAGKIRLAITVDDLLLWKGIPWAPGHSPYSVSKALTGAFSRHAVHGVYAFSGTAPADSDNDLLKVFDAWVERGHYISNHTHYHANLNWTEADHYIRDIEKTESIIDRWSRQSPTRFFRYAMDNWGNTQAKFDEVSSYLTRADYRTAPISVWFYDTEFLPAHYRASLAHDVAALQHIRKVFSKTAWQQLRIQSAAARAMFGHDPIYIWLVHATPLAAECIDRILDGFAMGGVEFVGLDQAISDPVNQRPVPLITARFLNHIQKWAEVRKLRLDECPPAAIDEIERISPMTGLSRPEVMTKVFKGICDEVGGAYVPKAY